MDLEHPEQVDKLLSTATSIAQANGSTIHLLYVIHAGPVILSQYLPINYEKMVSGKAQQALGMFATQLDMDRSNISSSVRFGTIYKEVLNHAKKHNEDLIIIGSHKAHVADNFLGSNASSIVRHAPCSTFVVR